MATWGATLGRLHPAISARHRTLFRPRGRLRHLVGPLWTHKDADSLAFAILPEARHANRLGIRRGGMLMTLADRVMGETARAEQPDQRHATMQLDVDFINAARIGKLIEARARVVRRTRQLMFIEARLTAGTRILAKGTGIGRLLAARRLRQPPVKVWSV